MNIGERFVFEKGASHILLEVLNQNKFKILQKLSGCTCSNCMKPQLIEYYGKQNLTLLLNQDNLEKGDK